MIKIKQRICNFDNLPLLPSPTVISVLNCNKKTDF
jgi:hypothetical protein